MILPVFCVFCRGEELTISSNICSGGEGFEGKLGQSIDTSLNDSGLIEASQHDFVKGKNTRLHSRNAQQSQQVDQGAAHENGPIGPNLDQKRPKSATYVGYPRQLRLIPSSQH